jgi:hypothetical protein
MIEAYCRPRQPASSVRMRDRTFSRIGAAPPSPQIVGSKLMGKPDRGPCFFILKGRTVTPITFVEIE